MLKKPVHLRYYDPEDDIHSNMEKFLENFFGRKPSSSASFLTDLTEMEIKQRKFECKIVRIGDVQLGEIKPMDKCNFKVYVSSYKHDKKVQLVDIKGSYLSW